MQAIVWVVAQLAGAIATNHLLPFLIAIWAAALAREARRPDPDSPRRVQIRLAFLNIVFVLVVVIPMLVGKMPPLPSRNTQLLFDGLYGAAMILHAGAWVVAMREGRRLDDGSPRP